MAPFKLKFRMGSSRSTSQEVDSDPQVNQSLLSHHHHQNNNNYCNNNLDIGASNSTIDSVDLNGDLISIENNERISLLPNTTNEKLGYTNPIVTHSSTDGTSVDRNSPPLLSFEHFIEDNHLENLNLGNRLTISKTEIASSSSIENDNYCLNGGVVNGELVNIEEEDQQPTIINIINTINHQISSQSINDLKCISTPNIILSPSKPNTKTTTTNISSKAATLESTSGTTAATTTTVQSNQILCDVDNQQQQQQQQLDGNRKESIDSTEYLISTMTSTPPSSQENLLLNSNDDECTGSCEPLFRASSSLSQSITITAAAGAAAGTASSKAYTINQQELQSIEQNQMEQHVLDDNIMGGENSRIHNINDDIDVNSYDDPRSHQYCTGPNDQDCPSYIAEMNEIENNKRANERNNYDSASYLQNNYYSNGDSDDNQWDDFSNQQQINHEQLQHFISNKSSKKIYKAVAKQWGITCKMSDQCRCMDCQSKYFDCEYDQNEHHKTDGGLGAGTPMFISEVMHGTACTIL